MTVPAFLDTSFRFLEVASVSDVDTIITNARTELVTNLGWTEPVANRFKSPVDSAGQFFEVLLTRVSATELEMEVFDTVGRSFSRELQISGTVTVQIFSGSHHLYIENVTGGEYLWGTLLSLSPDADSAHDHNVLGNGFRDTAGTASQNNVTFVFHVEGNSFAATEDVLKPNNRGQSGVLIPPETVSGVNLWYPVFFKNGNSGAGRFLGRAYQMLLVSSTFAAGSEVTLELDDTTSGTFKVVNVPSADNYRFAFRRS